jgi:menaquinone-specific isochorismate synthase
MTTYELPGGLDLVGLAGTGTNLWISQGRGLAGIGTAMSWELPGGKPGLSRLAEGMSGLRELANRSPGLQPYPTVLGAVPFLPGRTTVLLLPEVLVRWERSGRCAASVVHAGDPPSAADVLRLLERGDTASVYPEEYNVRSGGLSHLGWKTKVREATNMLERGDIQKVVLARRVRISANGPIPRQRVLARLCKAYPSCMVFDFGGFVGASPELVISRSGHAVKSYPLAGTAEYRAPDTQREPDKWNAELRTDKNFREHKWVTRAIEHELARYCDELHVEDEPQNVRAGAVIHLGTPIRGRLRAPAPTSLELCRRLVPTPAVGGYPREAALDYIARAEGFDRGLYGGAVGWMDSTGDGEWALGIRCGQISGAEAELYAGVGLVSGSDPEAELLETQWKFKPMIDAILMP